MLHCLSHATPVVRTTLLRAGVKSAMDLAGWFLDTSEVDEYVRYKGWTEADSHGLRLAWSEACRREIQVLPDVPTPEVTAPPLPTEEVFSVFPEERAIASMEALAPPTSTFQPVISPIRQGLQALYFELGPQGAFWDAAEPLEEDGHLGLQRAQGHPTVCSVNGRWQRRDLDCDPLRDGHDVRLNVAASAVGQLGAES